MPFSSAPEISKVTSGLLKHLISAAEVGAGESSATAPSSRHVTGSALCFLIHGSQMYLSIENDVSIKTKQDLGMSA